MILVFLFITDIMGIIVAINMSLNNNPHTASRMIYWCSYTLFLIFGSLLVFLSFEMNYGCYKCFCNKCHNKCNDVCEKCADREIQKNAPKTKFHGDNMLIYNRFIWG